MVICRRRAGAEIRRPFATIRCRVIGRNRRPLCPEAARPRLGRDDPQISAAARPVPDQSHQGVRALKSPFPPPYEAARDDRGQQDFRLSISIEIGKQIRQSSALQSSPSRVFKGDWKTVSHCFYCSAAEAISQLTSVTGCSFLLEN